MKKRGKCKVNGCNAPHRGLGYCRKHYDQIRAHGKILKRTRYDKNEINCYGDVCYMKMYNIKGKIVGSTKFNKQHLKKIKKYRWFFDKTQYTHYVVTANIGNKWVYLHNLIKNPPKELEVDHIDWKGNNNCDSNLRIVTHSQNACHKRIEPKYYYKRSNKWIVSIIRDGKEYNFGRFYKKKDAIKKAQEVKNKLKQKESLF